MPVIPRSDKSRNVLFDRSPPSFEGILPAGFFLPVPHDDDGDDLQDPGFFPAVGKEPGGRSGRIIHKPVDNPVEKVVDMSGNRSEKQ